MANLFRARRVLTSKQIAAIKIKDAKFQHGVPSSSNVATALGQRHGISTLMPGAGRKSLPVPSALPRTGISVKSHANIRNPQTHRQKLLHG